jgi:hypothetical protein
MSSPAVESPGGEDAARPDAPPAAATWLDVSAQGKESMDDLLRLLPELPPLDLSRPPPQDGSRPRDPAPPPARPDAPPRRRARRWLGVAAAVVAAATLALQLAAPRGGLTEGRGKDVVVLDPAQLPDGGLLAEARLRGGTMVCVVADGWARLSGEGRQEKLQAWLRHGQGRGVREVLLLDSEGLPVNVNPPLAGPERRPPAAP